MVSTAVVAHPGADQGIHGRDAGVTGPVFVRPHEEGSNGALDYDVVIIGSGFGGSVAALRAAEKGYREVQEVEDGIQIRV
jgi:hypothetical protein